MQWELQSCIPCQAWVTYHKAFGISQIAQNQTLLRTPSAFPCLTSAIPLVSVVLRLLYCGTDLCCILFVHKAAHFIHSSANKPLSCCQFWLLLYCLPCELAYRRSAVHVVKRSQQIGRDFIEINEEEQWVNSQR